MRILDRYILKELLGPFLFGITAFSSIFIGTGPMFRIAQLVSQYGASVAVVLKLFIYSIPSIVVLTFPMSMLLASLLSFGRLSAASEITAMRSGGQSFARLATPVFIVALLVSLVAVVLNERVVPAANAAYNYIVRYEMEKNTKPRTQEHIIIKTIKQGFMERLTYAREFSEDTGLMQSVTMQEFAADHLARVEHAEKAVWRDDHWVMQNGIIHELSPEGKVERVMRFDEQDLPVERAPVDISREQKKPEEMTIVELKQNIKILRSEYVKTNKYEVELHQRLAIPMASFVFALIGTPLGLSPNRSSSSIGLGLSIVIIFIYYTVMTITTALGQGGALPAAFSAWAPNLVGILAGLYLIRKASR